MACIRLTELLKYEVPHYQDQLRQRKEYFDNITGEDNWRYLIERDFQKRFFHKWAAEEKKVFCRGCDANGSCDMKF